MHRLLYLLVFNLFEFLSDCCKRFTNIFIHRCIERRAKRRVVDCRICATRAREPVHGEGGFLTRFSPGESEIDQTYHWFSKRHYRSSNSSFGRRRSRDYATSGLQIWRPVTHLHLFTSWLSVARFRLMPVWTFQASRAIKFALRHPYLNVYL